MKRLDTVTAGAQIALSVLYTLGYFTVLVMFMMGLAEVPERFENSFTGLLNLLSAAQLAVIYFWFQRQRGEKPQEVKNEGP